MRLKGRTRDTVRNRLILHDGPAARHPSQTRRRRGAPEEIPLPSRKRGLQTRFGEGFAGLARHGADEALHLELVVVIMHAGANQRVDAGRERIAFICSNAR